MIEVKDIHKSFGDQHILKGVSATFHKGETSMIIGTSGSGKTVFLKCLLGLFLLKRVISVTTTGITVK